MYREDYYKFSHYFLPYSLFKFGNLIIKRILEDKDGFIKNLKTSWRNIELEKSFVRSNPPSFEIDNIEINKAKSLIVVKMPEAKEEKEALYIGIGFNKKNDIRYFTYEIGKGIHFEDVYFLCEWTKELKHINHGVYSNKDIGNFIGDIKALF
ncbi:hypothetical protein [Clostridium felsineum]|uniref:Uncharacterized protein n=1 Tax=Clostridium felsineum TaxID=36839 RepID=A0A1S8KYH1_9CLOT|nr:hypothetical protein [Clostridium felsineum]MCR3760580.1 hypothetical protein [Clostridium felsineum]URZ03853.1 hypothetical protein CLAUR_039190 [Clostridium felsineum]URZ07869.1 hypothetical protein CLROS_032300 [Clostridium felsineum]URZ12900.1 hypothetical protein CROST_036450 [Clostridium felsineum]URZ15130.1 hypothetical protein CLFE_011480 [Clostridium felsineum DSM 794]